MRQDRRHVIGDVSICGSFILAPMAGITDAAMRILCAGMGASLTYTEMVSAKALHYNDTKTEKLLYIPESAGKTAIQIFGSDPAIMGEAARRLNDRKNVILDINMGCPAPKVVKNGDGSALMKDPDLVYDILREVTSNTDKPVTVKIRKGFYEKDINAIEVAKAAEAGGAAAVCVHGRTREQFYRDRADWNIVKAVREAIDIPVIANGDIVDLRSATDALETTGCELMMVGRAAIGNPWIFKELKAGFDGETYVRPSIDEKSRVMHKHLDMLIDLKGEMCAVREMRKHVAWYVKGMKNAARIRETVNHIESAEEMKEVLRFEAQR